MEYCCHVWSGAPSCYLELLDKLQKWICGTVGPSLAVSLVEMLPAYVFSMGITLVDHIVHPPFCWGVEPPTKFSKKRGGGLDRISIFRGGLLGKRG